MTGDMNGKYGLVSQFKPNLKQRMLHFVENGIDTMAQKFDCFIFATKDMAKGFHVEKSHLSLWSVHIRRQSIFQKENL